MTTDEKALEGLFAEVVRLRDAGDLEGALEHADRYRQLAPDRFAIELLRGAFLRSLGRVDEAVVAFRIMLERLPRHALASRGLYHALLELGLVEEARGEAVRYLALVDSGKASRAPRDLQDLYRGAVEMSRADLVEVADAQRLDNEARRATRRRRGTSSM